MFCSLEGRQAANINPDPNGHGGMAEGERISEMSATNWLARQVTKAELKELKAKSRKAKDPITREWYAALLEGMKESPWYSDDNAPSLYRDRYMRFVAIVVVAIAKGHALTMNGLKLLRGFRRQT
jgi:hypothetical protein